MPNMDIPQVNGRIVANAYTASSLWAKEKLGPLTDRNFIANVLQQAPQKYDKSFIKLFTDTALYYNDFNELIDKQGNPFLLNSPTGTFTYDIKKKATAPKVVKNLAASLATPGRDESVFYMVFDKLGFSQGDIITADRYNQNTAIQVRDDGQPYGEYYQYACSAMGATKDDFVQQRYLAVGVEYMIIGNALGEFTRKHGGLGLIDGKLSVIQDVLQEYSVEHSITDWADATEIGGTFDMDGNPMDITYYTITSPDPNNPISGKSKTTLAGWEPTIVRLMRAEMARRKANINLWGTPGNGLDENGLPVRAKAGIWYQMNNTGNVRFYNRGQFSLNLVRSVVSDLCYNRIAVEQRHIKIYTNRSGMQLASQAMRQDFNSQGFVINAKDFLDGDRMKLGYALQFDHFMTTETGLVEFKELHQLDEAATWMELGPNKQTAPIYMILDVSNSGGANIRTAKLKNRLEDSYYCIKGATQINNNLYKMAGGAQMAASRDRYDTHIMTGWTGSFIEDLTKAVLIKEYPQR